MCLSARIWAGALTRYSSSHEIDETACCLRKSIPQVFFFKLHWLNTVLNKCSAWFDRATGFHQNRADWTFPLMWIFVSAGTKQKGLSGRVLASTRSQIMRGPIWAGNNTFLVSAFNLNAFGRGLVLCESGEGSPTYSKHAHTHLDGEKRAIGLTAHMGLLTQHALRRLLEPRPQSYFYSCPISSTTSPTFSGHKVNHLTVSTAAEICFFFISRDCSPIMNIIFVFLKFLGGFIVPRHYSSAVSGGGIPSCGIPPLPSAGGAWISHHCSSWQEEKMMFLCTGHNMSQHSGTKLESSRGPCLWLNCS